MKNALTVQRMVQVLFWVAALPTLTGCYMFRSSETFYGLKTAGQKVLFVVDISGSMEGKNEGSLQDQATGMAVQAGGNALGSMIGGSMGRMVGSQTASEATKLGGAKRELIPAIQGLPASTSFSILTFGNDVKSWPLGMVAATGQNTAAATAFLKQLEANGGTPAREALEVAFAQQDANLIFFLSDGQPTDSSANQILARMRELNAHRRVVISTVGLGGDQDERFLAALAVENGGQYVKK